MYKDVQCSVYNSKDWRHPKCSLIEKSLINYSTHRLKKLHTFIKKNKVKNKLVALYGVIENNLKQF